MALLKTEHFTNENGEEMIRNIYDTMVIEKSVSILEEDSSLTTLEQQDARETYIMAMLEG